MLGKVIFHSLNWFYIVFWKIFWMIFAEIWSWLHCLLWEGGVLSLGFLKTCIYLLSGETIINYFPLIYTKKCLIYFWKFHKIHYKFIFIWKYQCKFSFNEYRCTAFITVWYTNFILFYLILACSDWAHKEAYLFWHCNITGENKEFVKGGPRWSSNKEKKRFRVLVLSFVINSKNVPLNENVIKLAVITVNCILMRQKIFVEMTPHYQLK